MKKLIYASLFAALSFSLTSCMNGDYDANPATDNSGILNPLAPAGTASKGQIIGKVNGIKRVFGSAYYSGNIIMQGVDFSNNVNHNITFFISNYNGAGTYQIGGDAQATYAELDASLNLKQYNTNSGTQAGSGSITVTEDANNELKGTYTFTAYATGSTTDKVVVTEGSFDVPKQ